MQYHARHVFDFAGRDARQTFWFWFLFLFIVNIAVGFAMSIPMTAAAMSTAFEGARSGHPEAVQAKMIGDMAEAMRPMLAGAIVLGLVNVVLIAASFVRRLHDSGKSGLWAALAGAIYLVSLWLSWTHADEAVALMSEAAAGGSMGALEAQSRMGWQGLLGYVPMIMVIGFGLLKSGDGPNRYGEDAVRF
jgi:uncharacterized membrane protein YhaH (DUF805 family)